MSTSKKEPDAGAVRVSVAKCPICGEPVEPRYRPFCSKRCADLDLGRWISGVYRVETEETGDPEEKE